MNLQNTQTLKNLTRAYATETHDGARYQFIRQQAMQQQNNFIANTLKMLATNEMAHAKVWWDLITDKDKVSFDNVDLKAGFPFATGDFKEQFKIVAEVEQHEGEKLYLEFAKTAKKEGFDDIAKKFEMTAAVERKHSDILKQIYEGLNQGKLYKTPQEKAWKCTKCGYEEKSKTAWKTCPVCQMPQGYAEGNVQM